MDFGIRVVPKSVALGSEATVLVDLFNTFSGDIMSIQRPSAAVRSYSITRAEIQPVGWEKQYGEELVRGPLFKAHLEFDLDLDVISKIQTSWGDAKREFTVTRSRVAAIAVRRLCYTENTIRIARAHQRGDWQPNHEVASAARRAWWDFEHTMWSHLCIGEHTDKYIREHPSHVAPNVLWEDLYSHEGAIEQLLQACKDHLKLRLDEGLATENVLHPSDMHFGLRARSPPLESDVIGPTHDIEIGRTRIVTYRGAMSGVNAFIPEDIEIKAYRRAIETVAKAAGYTGKVFSPVIDGGKFYVKMSELMSTYNYAATDGANWESNVPMIIPDILAYTYTGGPALCLPSGAHDTSLLGSLASIVLAADLKGVQAISLQGDDLGLFYTNKVLYRDIPGISELDPMDTKLKYVLGYSFLEPDLPHSIGIKLTTDSADYMDSRSISNPGPPRTRGLTEDAISRWIAVYTGILPDGRTLLEELEMLPAGVEMYPRKTMELIQDGNQHEEVV